MLPNKPVFSSSIKEILDVYASRCIASHAESTLINDFCALKSFDAYLESIGFSGTDIGEDMISQWAETLGIYSLGRIEHYERTISIFLRFARAYGISSVMIPITKVPDEYTPFIFTQPLINELCERADDVVIGNTSVNPWMRVEFPMISRILFSTGARLGETLSLRMKNYDSDSMILFFKETKEDKERQVPIHEDLNRILRAYCSAMGITAHPNALLFPGKSKEVSLNRKAYHELFIRIIRDMGIESPAHNKRERGICPHCLRHSFACHSLRQLQSKGIHVDNLYPYLSIYMGHSGLYETQKYLKLLPSMVSDETKQYEEYIKSQGFITRALQDDSEWY